MIRVQTELAEFSAAESNGYVYGQIRRSAVFPVYVVLGTETPYTLSTKDDPKTQYRRFVNCTVYYAETEEQLDGEQYLAVELGVTVVIYC